MKFDTVALASCHAEKPCSCPMQLRLMCLDIPIRDHDGLATIHFSSKISFREGRCCRESVLQAYPVASAAIERMIWIKANIEYGWKKETMLACSLWLIDHSALREQTPWPQSGSPPSPPLLPNPLPVASQLLKSKTMPGSQKRETRCR